MSLSFTTQKRIRPKMIRKTDPNGVFHNYIEKEANLVATDKAVIVRQPTDTVPPLNAEADDVVMDTLEFDCFGCYRWWFCCK